MKKQKFSLQIYRNKELSQIPIIGKSEDCISFIGRLNFDFMK
jgi:hypothetical protein